MWIAALIPPALNQFFGECTWFLCSLTVYDIKWVYVSASNENIDFTGDSCSVCGGVLLWQCRIIIKRFINLWSMKFPRCYSKPVIMSSFNENSLLTLTWTIPEKYRPRCAQSRCSINRLTSSDISPINFFCNPLKNLNIWSMTWYGNHKALKWFCCRVHYPDSKGFKSGLEVIAGWALKF